MASFIDNGQDCGGFHCLGEVNLLNRVSLSNTANCSLNFEIKSSGKVGANVSQQYSTLSFVNLFGNSILKSSILETEVFNHLIMLSKREILSLKCSALQWHSVTKKTYLDSGLSSRISVNVHRANVLNFLSSLNSILRDENFVESLENEDDNVFTDILSKLSELLLCCGRISSIPDYIIQNSLKDSLGKSPSHQYYHLILDIWWNVLLCFKKIQEISKEQLECVLIDNIAILPLSCQENNFRQIAMVIMWDLTCLAHRKFTNIQHASDYPKLVPFHCSCLRDIWSMLVRLLNQQTSEDSFWVYWLYISQELVVKRDDENNEDEPAPLTSFNLKPNSFPISQNPQFCLWMLTNLAELFQINDKGVFQAGIKVQSNYNELNKLVELIIKSENQSRLTRMSAAKIEDLDFILKSCLTLSNLWETNVELLLILTDYFLKNMNDSGPSNINYQTLISKNGRQWFTKITEFHNTKSKGTPFYLYLALINAQFSQISSIDKKQSVQRRIIGRIFPKINEKFIQELSQIGLEKLFSLQLSLGLWGILKDIVPRICGISRMIPISPIVKKSIFIKALFTCVHIHQEKREDATLVTKTLGEQFMTIYEQYVNPDLHSKNLTPHDLMSLIVQYFEGLQDVVTCSPNLSLSEHFLINETFYKLLPHCGFSEIAAALNAIEHAILRLQELLQLQEETRLNEKQMEVLNKIEQFVVPFLNQHAMISQTPPKQISTVAVGLTLLYLESNLTKSNSLIENFGLNSRVSSQINSSYLCHVLSNSEVLNNLNEHQQFIALAIWLRCSLNSYGIPAEQFTTLTRLIFSLPAVKSVFTNPLEQLLENGGTSRSLVLTFFRQIEAKNPRENLEFKKRLLEILKFFINDVKCCINPKDGTFSNSETLKEIFVLSSHLILYLGPILNSVENNYISLLLDNTVLSLYLLNEKRQINQVILNACNETLPIFLMGLSRLAFDGMEQSISTSTSYIQRKMKDIITNYVPRFPSFQNNFILNVLFHKNSYYHCDKLFKFVLETIYDKFLLLRKGSDKKSPHFHIAMNLCMHILDASSGENKPWLSEKILTCILEHLHSQMNDSKTLTILRQSLSAILKPSGECEARRLIVLRCLESFITKHLPWTPKNVFQLLEDIVVMAGTDLMSELFQTLSRNIEIIEKKRGAGVDQLLRKGLERFDESLRKGR